MSNHPSQMRYGTFIFSGLGIAILVAGILSSFVSSNPDGLNRVAEDLEFIDKEHPEPPAQKLPFAGIFDGYATKGVPEQIATPIAGVVGTLAAFGLAWGFGKLFIRRSDSSTIDSEASD